MTTVTMRRRRPGYHRAAGRTLVVGSALGMTLMYPQAGTAWLLNLAVAEWAVRRRPAPRRRPQPAVVEAQP